MKSQKEELYFRLDNSAVFMAAIAGGSGPFVFRFSCEMTSPVNLNALSRALVRLAPRFPFFFVCLRRGVFWYYLEPVEKVPAVVREEEAPCGRLRPGRGKPMVRVSAWGRTVACEFHHAITDGTGALTFLRALVGEYLLQAGLVEDSPDSFTGLLRPGDSPHGEEAEDAYSRYFEDSAPLPDAAPPSFLLPGDRMITGYRETVGILSLEEVLALARSRKVSLTELLTAVYIASLEDIHEIWFHRRRRKHRPVITVQVPVNLRKIYPSRTLRNFFLFASPSIDLRLGHWSFSEILEHVHHQLRLGVEKKELLRQLKRNVGGERNPLARPILLPIKTVVLRIINAVIGVGSYSGSISNIGAVDMPPACARHISRFLFIPSRARATGANIGMLSWGDTLYICFGSLVRKPELERIYFSRLAALGLTVRIETNKDRSPA